MYGLNECDRYYVCTHPVSMRKGIDGLFSLIRGEFPMTPFGGGVFVFFSKDRRCVKVLKWDRDGFLLYQKRLERGTFAVPRWNSARGCCELPWETIVFIMRGSTLLGARRAVGSLTAGYRV